MTQEETKTIWIDLSARVMYHHKINVYHTYLNQRYDDVLTCANFTQFSDVKYEVKPYLRSMNSMTEEEHKEYNDMDLDGEFGNNPYCKTPNIAAFNWLNAHHFDYNGLIEKGLAIEATKDMYKS